MRFPAAVIATFLAVQVSSFSTGTTHITSHGRYNHKSPHGRHWKEIAGDKKALHIVSPATVEAENTIKAPRILDFVEEIELPTGVDVDIITQLVLNSDLKNVDAEKDDFVAQVETAVRMWASTKSIEGAETIQSMIERLEEADANLVSSKMFELVRAMYRN